MQIFTYRKVLKIKFKAVLSWKFLLAGKAVFEDLKANINAAKAENIPICQDTGMAVIFMEIGQDVHFTGGSFEDAINKGVSRGYTEGYLRCSIVGDPLERVNTGDNTPPVVHTRIVSGDKVKIDVWSKRLWK